MAVTRLRAGPLPPRFTPPSCVHPNDISTLWPLMLARARWYWTTRYVSAASAAACARFATTTSLHVCLCIWPTTWQHARRCRTHNSGALFYKTDPGLAPHRPSTSHDRAICHCQLPEAWSWCACLPHRAFVPWLSAKGSSHLSLNSIVGVDGYQFTLIALVPCMSNHRHSAPCPEIPNFFTIPQAATWSWLSAPTCRCHLTAELLAATARFASHTYPLP